ncbi:hypothetical protein F5148DRAFT_797744 [Russula earlei]|uniref:Uncharacterized protein n=1 Tax=Russula earlei TaxID=71964 RepID=A0ACC0UEC0_9AGAM|nr:hypothetical protein F5148DRAFT_797744 [Russula earlei]
MPTFRRHDARRRPLPGGVHLSRSSASLSSLSSSSSSTPPSGPPSNACHSDIADPSPTFTAPKSHLPPDTILPVPRSSSLIPSMGQVPSRSPSDLAVPPPSPTVPPSSGGAGSRLKRVFGSRKKKSEDVPPNALVIVAPMPVGMGKSRSVMTPASSTASSPAPKLPQQPSVSAGPGYPTSPFTRHLPAEHTSDPPLKPLPESPPPRSITSSPSPSDQGNTLIAATPAISAALQYVSGAELGGDVANVMRRPRKKDSDHEVIKEDWRKSDATTTSYYTVRPRSGASGGTRTPRPVSMAESLHSTNTVVPPGRRLSALLTEAEFIMTEEGMSRSSTTSLSRKTSPSGSSKTRKRHSISLSFTSPLPPGPPATSATTSEGLSSSRPVFHHRPSGDVATSRAAANGIIGPLQNGDSQSAGTHIRGNLAALSAAPSPPRSLPHQPSSSSGQPGPLRQTAITVTSGLAPAAGFAMGFGKRAVERMGRAFGSLGSGHNVSGHSSSSSSISGMDDFGRSASNVSLASHASQTHTGKGKQRRTPNAPSGAWSVNTLSSTSTGQTDNESVFTGPTLGTRLREPMRNNSGAFVVGGLVFGRDLTTCVQTTAIDAIRLAPSTSDTSQLVSAVLHERRLPALVVRCTEHLMKWGAEEEGLFRISGRATHVAKLRSEFDNGADFDLLESDPSDLDPHAVASVFKTYLRELPEPILTHALNHYFEAAMLTETNVRKSIEEQAAPARNVSGGGSSLPSGPQDGHSLRKPPSLSTLALPNFSGMRPPSQGLLNTFASLLARLPRENRDLLRTVIDLVNFVAERKEIRMPLSNLTVVLCPTLNMSPPILRVLSEAKGIWNGPLEEGWEDVNDFDPEGKQSDPLPETLPAGSGAEQNYTTELSLAQGDQGSSMEIGTGASDPTAEIQAPGEDQDDIHDDNKTGSAPDDRVSYVSVGDSRPSTPAWGKGSPLDPWLPPALTSSSDSLTTPSTSSEAPSIPQVIAPAPVNMYFSKENPVPGIIPDFVRTSADHVPVSFPISETAPGTPLRRPSNVPALTILSSEPSSQSLKPPRAKRPSLTALFSKASVSSLRSSRLFSSSVIVFTILRRARFPLTVLTRFSKNTRLNLSHALGAFVVAAAKLKQSSTNT